MPFTFIALVLIASFAIFIVSVYLKTTTTFPWYDAIFIITRIAFYALLTYGTWFVLFEYLFSVSMLALSLSIELTIFVAYCNGVKPEWAEEQFWKY